MSDYKFETDDQDHIIFAGHLLVLSIWVQNMLTDLVILMEDPLALKDFKELLPDDTDYWVRQQEGRMKYDQKSLSIIIRRAFELEPLLTQLYKRDFEYLRSVRDLLAHGRYSLKRRTVLYQPDRSRKDLDDKLRVSMGTFYESADNIGINGLSLRLDIENCNAIFDRLMVFERLIFPFLGLKLGIDINRIK